MEDGRKAVLLRIAVVFYLGFAAVAVGWAWIAGRRSVFWWGDGPPDLAGVAGWAAGGVGFGVAVALVTRLLMGRFRFAEELSRWFGEVLGRVTWREALLLALLSGFAEEMLFRGAMQPSLGLWPAAVLFGVVHWPPSVRLVPWTVSAFLLGLVFAFAAEASEHLAGPIAAHFTVNLLNLRQVTESASSPPSDPDAGAPPPPRTPGPTPSGD